MRDEDGLISREIGDAATVYSYRDGSYGVLYKCLDAYPTIDTHRLPADDLIALFEAQLKAEEVGAV
jgi:hypothetical protein